MTPGGRHSHQGDVSTTDGRDLGCDISSGVDDVIGTELLSERQLVVIDIHCDRAASEHGAVLQAKVAKPTDADDHDGLGRLWGR